MAANEARPERAERVVGARWMHLLRATVVDVSWTAEEAWSPAPDLAVQVRGALGAAFTRAVCERPPRDCAPCPIQGRCLVPTWYEPNVVGGHSSRPFSVTVEPPPSLAVGERLHARLVFHGAIPDPDAILRALRFAGGEGFGATRARHDLAALEVRGEGAPAWVVVDGARRDAWPAPGTLEHLVSVPARASGAFVSLRSPLQADDPRRSTAPLEPADLVLRCIRRVQALAEAEGVWLPVRWPAAPEGIGRWEGRRWVEKTVWSQRQQAEIVLSGWRGELVYGAGIEAFADVLAACCLVSVGRQTSYGLGALSVGWRA
jgi:hypothetical protein